MPSDLLNLTISITEEHINASQPDHCWQCSIALAVYDAWATVDLAGHDPLYGDFDPTYKPFSVTAYHDGVIILWVESCPFDLILARGTFDVASVPVTPTRPITFEVQFAIMDDDILDSLIMDDKALDSLTKERTI